MFTVTRRDVPQLPPRDHSFVYLSHGPCGQGILLFSCKADRWEDRLWTAAALLWQATCRQCSRQTQVIDALVIPATVRHWRTVAELLGSLAWWQDSSGDVCCWPPAGWSLYPQVGVLPPPPLDVAERLAGQQMPTARCLMMGETQGAAAPQLLRRRREKGAPKWEAFAELETARLLTGQPGPPPLTGADVRGLMGYALSHRISRQAEGLGPLAPPTFQAEALAALSSVLSAIADTLDDGQTLAGADVKTAVAEALGRLAPRDDRAA